MNFEKYGGRRYLLCWGSLISADVLQWFGKMDLAGLAWGGAVALTVGAYIAGNVKQKQNEGAAK
ncbi:hypothetical protein [Rhodoferax fermentans]|uniref:Holin n=1 Tax=Rhodoferax fermentans TaxID=28066 RepID=A0A1T1ANP8_RHOFE|nr:hypothetical protein [Rhodoferax fermentans]OOV05760.1 hypothetical protein RF819_02710 [Rhodoferax fermentans]